MIKINNVFAAHQRGGILFYLCRTVFVCTSPKRWSSDLVKDAGKRWMRIAQDWYVGRPLGQPVGVFGLMYDDDDDDDDA